MNHARQTNRHLRIAALIGAGALTAGLPAQAGLRVPDAATVDATGKTYAVISDAALRDALEKFAKLRSRRQAKVVAAVREAVGKLDDPYLRSLRGLAGRGAEAGKPRYKALRVGKRYGNSETANKTSGALVDQLPFRVHNAYRWAFGHVEPHATHGGKRMSKTRRQRAATLAQLEDLCAGHPLDVDQVLAGMLRELDNERSADAHAVFLESWRNGAETFYQALARTAGTGKGVFCYDAMLSDWTRRCVGKKHPEYRAMIKSLDATQRAFYQAAATYRSYRGLREMVALSLLLPSDCRLPEQLARLYEDNAGAGYSTRDNVLLLLAANQGDVEATLGHFLRSVEPMPLDTWHGGFSPVKGLYAAVQQSMPKLVAGGGHSDRVLAEQKRKRAAIQGRVAQVARRALLAGLAR